MEEPGAGRIATCVECGLRLPLLRPGDRSQAETWICNVCDCHYHAVLDEEQVDLRDNVRRGSDDG